MSSSAASPISVRNPRTGEADYEITPPTATELHALTVRLRENQRAWGTAPMEHRVEVLSQWADQLEKSATSVIEAESVDMGHAPLAQMSPLFVVMLVRRWCERAESAMDELMREGQSELMPNIEYSTQLVPYPLVGVIGPWNGPLGLSILDAIPALFAGCAVVVKPSEVTPRFVEPLMATIAEVPELAGVLQYVVGDGRTGQAIVEEVDAVCFTGSVRNGRKVAEACARRLIPVFLELGGKDPVIITASADVEMAATAVLRGSVFNTGQGCSSAERIYVHENLHDAFVERLVTMAQEVRLNHPDPQEGNLSPFIFEPQAAIVDAHIDDALAKGATLRSGGRSERLGGGLYMLPVVLTDVTHDMEIMRHETFGPIMPIMRFRDDEEALRLANDTEFGLSASVIAGTAEEAKALARHLDAGEIAIQDVCLTMIGVFDGGSDSFGCSGLGGVRGGSAGIHRFVRRKAFLTNTAEPSPLAAGF